jgi:hypothetical protein
MSNCAIPARRRPLSLAVAILVLLSWAAVAAAQPAADVVRIEEDWELVVGTPDSDSDAPQVTCVISPMAGVESWHAALELNQQGLPVFAAGGLQLQVWEGEVPLSDRRFPNGAVLGYAGETVRWTQTMQLDDGELTFEVVNGTSATWGNFGGQGYLKASIATTLGSLDAYNPNVSANNSGVSYAANRVHSLILKRVRYFTSTGEQYEDDTARIVHLQD